MHRWSIQWRPGSALSNCINFLFWVHFQFSFWITKSALTISFLHIEIMCFLSGEDVYRMKFTRCIFKTPAGFERAALTGREGKNHWWCFRSWISFRWLLSWRKHSIRIRPIFDCGLMILIVVESFYPHSWISKTPLVFKFPIIFQEKQAQSNDKEPYGYFLQIALNRQKHKNFT